MSCLGGAWGLALGAGRQIPVQIMLKDADTRNNLVLMLVTARAGG
jgi:hypothetical protein